MATWPSPFVAGAALTAAQLNGIQQLGAAWTAYTPTWGSAGTAPVLNNGTLVGSYVQAGKLVLFSMVLTFGSTTTAGTGNYTFSLPVAALSNSHLPIATGNLFDTSVPQDFARVAVQVSTTTISLVDTAGAKVTGTTLTWATGDMISISGMYQGA